jgi:uncharacterized protein YciI
MYVLEITSYMVKPDDKLLAEHRKYLKEVLSKGKLKLAGRMADNTGGILLWEVNSIQEAKELALKDPYYEKGVITFVLKEWNIVWNSFVNPPVTPI